MKRYYHFAVDIDDCIADFYKTALPKLIRHTNRVIMKKHFTRYDSPLTFFRQLDDFYQFIIDNNILSELELYPGAREAMHRLSRFGEITLVTSRGYHPEAHDITVEWLRRQAVSFNNLIIVPKNGRKSDVMTSQVDYFIDDHIENLNHIRLSNVCKNTILINQPWNALDHRHQRYSSLSSFVAKNFYTPVSNAYSYG